MAGSSTAELRLRPTGEDDLDYVVAAGWLSAALISSGAGPQWPCAAVAFAP